MSHPEPVLTDRLQAVGPDPGNIGDPADAWRRLRERFGPRITLVDRYALEAVHRGVWPEGLSAELRDWVTAEVLRVQVPGMEYVPGSVRSVRRGWRPSRSSTSRSAYATSTTRRPTLPPSRTRARCECASRRYIG